MPVIGSSAVVIPDSVEGPLGLTGPIGFTGHTGASGPTGATGLTGATGAYILSGYPYETSLKLVLSDGRELTIEHIHGPTGVAGNADGLTLGDNQYSIFKEVSDGTTFWFKGITTEGSLGSYISDNTIGISGDIPYIVGVVESAVKDRLAYLSGTGTVNATKLWTESDGTISFGTTDAGNEWSYDPEEVIVPIGPLPQFSADTDDPIIYGITGGEYEGFGPYCGGETGINLEVNRGSVYKIETPVGINEIVGDFNELEVFNFTIQLGGNQIWDWPSNVYFDEDDLYFSCGWDIINFYSYDAGRSWKATVTIRGYGTSDCESVHGLGSCCYMDDDNELNCRDYMTETECKELDSPFDFDGDGVPDAGGGYFNAFSTCAENCGMDAVGICCSEGGDWSDTGTRVCIENVGAAECDYFGGTFWNYFYYEREEETGRMVLLAEPIPITCDNLEGLLNKNRSIRDIITDEHHRSSGDEDFPWTYEQDGNVGEDERGACCMQMPDDNNTMGSVPYGNPECGSYQNYMTADDCAWFGGTFLGIGTEVTWKSEVEIIHVPDAECGDACGDPDKCGTKCRLAEDTVQLFPVKYHFMGTLMFGHWDGFWMSKDYAMNMVEQYPSLTSHPPDCSGTGCDSTLWGILQKAPYGAKWCWNDQNCLGCPGCDQGQGGDGDPTNCECWAGPDGPECQGNVVDCFAQLGRWDKNHSFSICSLGAYGSEKCCGFEGDNEWVCNPGNMCASDCSHNTMTNCWHNNLHCMPGVETCDACYFDNNMYNPGRCIYGPDGGSVCTKNLVSSRSIWSSRYSYNRFNPQTGPFQGEEPWGRWLEDDRCVQKNDRCADIIDPSWSCDHDCGIGSGKTHFPDQLKGCLNPDSPAWLSVLEASEQQYSSKKYGSCWGCTPGACCATLKNGTPVCFEAHSPWTCLEPSSDGIIYAPVHEDGTNINDGACCIPHEGGPQCIDEGMNRLNCHNQGGFFMSGPCEPDQGVGSDTCACMENGGECIPESIKSNGGWNPIINPVWMGIHTTCAGTGCDGGCASSGDCTGPEDCDDGLCCENKICVICTCTDDDDCGDGECCENKVCESSLGDSCGNHADCCGIDVVCCENNVCVTCTGDCTVPEDCDDGLCCENNVCVTCTGDCTDDDDCGAGQCCENNVCESSIGEYCGIDGDCCGIGVVCCEDNVCVTCTGACTDDDDCGAGLCCENDVCVTCSVTGSCCIPTGSGGYDCIVGQTQPNCLVSDGNIWHLDGQCTGECDDIGENCTNFSDDICVSPCCDPIACCKDGVCIGDSMGHCDSDMPCLPPLSRTICEFVYGGIAVPGECGEVDCCNATIYVGACCSPDGESCEETNSNICNSTGRQFMGPNTKCDGENAVNCCGDQEVMGACCNGESCSISSEDDCGGEWWGSGSACSPNPCQTSPVGACCLGSSCQDLSEKECLEADGTWYGVGEICCTAAGDDNRINGGRGDDDDGICCIYWVDSTPWGDDGYYKREWMNNNSCDVCCNKQDPANPGCCMEGHCSMVVDDYWACDGGPCSVASYGKCCYNPSILVKPGDPPTFPTDPYEGAYEWSKFIETSDCSVTADCCDPCPLDCCCRDLFVQNQTSCNDSVSVECGNTEKYCIGFAEFDPERDNPHIAFLIDTSGSVNGPMLLKSVAGICEAFNGTNNTMSGMGVITVSILTFQGSGTDTVQIWLREQLVDTDQLFPGGVYDVNGDGSLIIWDGSHLCGMVENMADAPPPTGATCIAGALQSAGSYVLPPHKTLGTIPQWTIVVSDFIDFCMSGGGARVPADQIRSFAENIGEFTGPRVCSGHVWAWPMPEGVIPDTYKNYAKDIACTELCPASGVCDHNGDWELGTWKRIESASQDFPNFLYECINHITSYSCCIPPGICLEIAPAVCEGLGGTSEMTSCNDRNCYEPKGRCCHLEPAACECPNPSHACCWNGGCWEYEEDLCVILDPPGQYIADACCGCSDPCGLGAGDECDNIPREHICTDDVAQQTCECVLGGFFEGPDAAGTVPSCDELSGENPCKLCCGDNDPGECYVRWCIDGDTCDPCGGGVGGLIWECGSQHYCDTPASCNNVSHPTVICCDHPDHKPNCVNIPFCRCVEEGGQPMDGVLEGCNDETCSGCEDADVDICNIPEGACCFTYTHNGSDIQICAETTENACVRWLGGDYQGDNELCEPCTWNTGDEVWENGTCGKCGTCCVQATNSWECEEGVIEQDCIFIPTEFDGPFWTERDSETDVVAPCCTCTDPFCVIEHQIDLPQLPDCGLSACCYEDANGDPICTAESQSWCVGIPDDGEGLGGTWYRCTSCTDDLCSNTTGACCVDTSCSIETAADCSASGGIYQGNDSTCGMNTCCPDCGACCVGTSCTEVSVSVCDGKDGDHYGTGVACTPKLCDDIDGGCCIDNECQTMTQKECISASGDWMGEDHECDDNPCGACCDDQGGCSTTTQFGCDNTGGASWQGDDSNCDTLPCTLGGCCLSGGGSCLDLTLYECGGGTWHNDLCTQNPCNLGTGMCCCDNPGDSCTDNITEVQCADPTLPSWCAWGGNWEAGQTCELDCANYTTGACCISNVCSVVTEGNCVWDGGTYQGDNSTCAGDPCAPPATGACCVGTSCGTGTEADCSAAGGTYQGDNSTCAGDPCAPISEDGACCYYANSTCGEDGTQQDCLNNSGTWMGIGSTCRACEGACCFDTSCSDNLSQDDCSNLSGIYQGIGILCADISCNPDYGSCCCENAGGMWSCTDNVTQSNCSLTCVSNYTWSPNGTCTANACGAPVGACCLSTDTCVENLTFWECGELGSYDWYWDDACADVNCTPITVGRCCYGDSTCMTDKSQAECEKCKGEWNINNSCAGDPCDGRPSCCNTSTFACDENWTCCTNGTLVNDCTDECVDDSYACCEKVGGIYTGNCSDITQQQCSDEDGQPLTSYDDCTMIDPATGMKPCDLGVCCYDDGGNPSCIRTIKYECDSISASHWKGDGECADFSEYAECADQDVPTGACCINNSCSEGWGHTACETAGGEYYGDNSVCSDHDIECKDDDPKCILCDATPPPRGKEFEDLNSYVKLPSGQCVWMNCISPNCPYPLCR